MTEEEFRDNVRAADSAAMHFHVVGDRHATYLKYMRRYLKAALYGTSRVEGDDGIALDFIGVVAGRTIMHVAWRGHEFRFFNVGTGAEQLASSRARKKQESHRQKLKERYGPSGLWPIGQEPRPFVEDRDNKVLDTYVPLDDKTKSGPLSVQPRFAGPPVLFGKLLVDDPHAPTSVEDAEKLKKLWTEAWPEVRSYHQFLSRHVARCTLPLSPEQVRAWEDALATPPLVDGITPEQCLERYEANMRADGPPEWLLTDAQKAMGREMWSAALKAKVTESKKRDAERAVSVVCDDDRWEE